MNRKSKIVKTGKMIEKMNCEKNIKFIFFNLLLLLLLLSKNNDGDDNINNFLLLL